MLFKSRVSQSKMVAGFKNLVTGNFPSNPPQAWTRALLLASLVTTCYGGSIPEFEGNDFSLHRSARSIFTTLGEYFFPLENFDPKVHYVNENAAEEIAKDISDKILEIYYNNLREALAKKIVEASVSDHLRPPGPRKARNSSPTGRSVGGIFSTFRIALNDAVDTALNWLILQGYFFMPERMDTFMQYLESESPYWDGDSGHKVQQRDSSFDDDDFIRMIASYQPDEQPTSSDPAECPNDSLGYSRCLKVTGLDYWAGVMKRADAALKKIRKYMDHE